MVTLFKILHSYKKLMAIVLVTVSSMIYLSGCNKQLEQRSSHLSPEGYTWNSYDGVSAALNGLYGLLRSAMADNNSYWVFGDLRNGDFTSVIRPDLKNIINGNLRVSYPVIQKLLDWRRFYAVINACNLFIERSPEGLADARYTELNNRWDVAQARAIRAYIYFYITRIWGDVPLVTTSRDGQNIQLPRTSQDKVLAFASSELLAVTRDLPYQYGSTLDPVFPNATYFGNSYSFYYNTLFNRIFAYSVLAHIAAWQGKYDEVDIYTQFVMNNYQIIGSSLITDITDLTDADGFFCGRKNQRQFFCIDMEAGVSASIQDDFGTVVGSSHSDGFNETGISGIGHIESLTLGSPIIAKQNPEIYVSKDSLANIFSEPTDVRFGLNLTTGAYTTNYITNYNNAIPVFSKFKVIGDPLGAQTALDVYSSSIVLDRLEEIYLLRAEALTALNKTNDAIILLNTIRGNRGETSYTGTGGQPLIDQIFAERRRELMGEGWRWYDLVRYNKLSRNNAAFNQLIDNGGIYWPIAQNVLQNNSSLVQNAYWR